MTTQEKQDLTSVYNDLVQLQNDFPNLPYGGATRIRNSIYLIGKHIEDVPKSPNLDGFKDFEFIYQGDNYKP